ncbi:MAG: YceI family protein [Chitinophagaceae bacterium]|nr:YceI family protein [Chitinophagaceae bacterium]MDB5222349.1 YceI family protein [Chitinophagaceae bacterium]
MVKNVSIAHMSRRFLITAAFILLLGSSFKDPVSIFNISRGNISFSSDAPLELITAGSNELKGLIETEKKQFAFSVKVRSFKGFNSGFQKDHFNENYLESDKYPDATFSGKIIEDVDFTKNNILTVRAKGILTVHGVPKERIIKSDMTIKNGSIFIKANFTVLLADHNIPIPKVVHEKLASEIKVEVNSELKIR